METERQIIEASLLFDRAWYLQKYADVAQAGVDPIYHYMTVGWHEGRDPGPAFTTSAYLKANEDVAKAGANPLLHFVQFGLAEGREGFGARHLPPSANREARKLAAPHECLSLQQPRPSPIVWRRSYRLDRRDPRFIPLGDTGAGYAPDDSTRAAFETAVEWLRQLSGERDGNLPGQTPLGNESAHRLIDAWHLNAAQLRTRWNGEKLPLVVRAFQCSPWNNGELRLVGEGAIASPVDLIDVHLLNPYFPILFALAAPDGVLRGTVLLAFPSLCRGGTHYAELLWAASVTARAPIDFVAASNKLMMRLVPLFRLEAQAAVGQIQVDKVDSDGNGPLFRNDLRVWLAKVLQIDIVERGSAGPADAPDLVQGGVSAAAIWRTGGGGLVVPSNAAPTISALLEHRSGSGERRSGRPAPLLASRLDPSKPALLIDVPCTSGLDYNGGRNPLPWLTPDASGLVPTDFPAAAIRVSGGQDLSDAQLLVPVSGVAKHRREARAAITWLVQPEDWQDDRLVEGVQCLALQRRADGDVLALIGPLAPGALGLARQHFTGEVLAFESTARAVGELKTPLVGCVGGGVLLHDPRTADCFSAMLANDRICTASCVVVSAQKRGGVVKTVIIDGGALVRADGQPAERAEGAAAAAELWQGEWSVLRPSAYLWATRSEKMISGWEECAQGFEGGAVHMCTSAVTATHLSSGKASLKIPDVPEARQTSTLLEWLVG